MRYIKEILKKNSIWVLVYIGLGIFNSFVANYKVDYFQKVIDGLADRTLAFAGVATYDLFAVAAYVIKKAVEEKEGASFVTILPSLIYQSFIRYQ